MMPASLPGGDGAGTLNFRSVREALSLLPYLRAYWFPPVIKPQEGQKGKSCYIYQLV